MKRASNVVPIKEKNFSRKLQNFMGYRLACFRENQRKSTHWAHAGYLFETLKESIKEHFSRKLQNFMGYRLACFRENQRKLYIDKK
ncbi:hypothetical protein T07_13980 [Trichinella nelsoni]|uniref:Uncharacterized protein n=1 Tax=Trichinella nelsoni TaxID=6336 RepID=A0A0V0RXE6_9BILA|nr:hypothetical protein T07_13980 [Trichinella nelsoni]